MKAEMIMDDGQSTRLIRVNYLTCVGSLPSHGDLHVPGPYRNSTDWQSCTSPRPPLTRQTPTPHTLTGLSAIAIAAGFYHTCAIAAEGGVKCWGYNWQGQLGIGSYESQGRPADVTGAAKSWCTS